MTNSQRLGQVRDALRQWLTMHSASANSGDPASEAMLIRDGFFCGRRFRYANYQAVWFLEEDQIKIHDAAGQLCDSCDAGQIEMLAEQWRASQVNAVAAVENAPPEPDEVRTLSIEDHRGQVPAAEIRRAA